MEMTTWAERACVVASISCRLAQQISKVRGGVGFIALLRSRGLWQARSTRTTKCCSAVEGNPSLLSRSMYQQRTPTLFGKYRVIMNDNARNESDLATTRMWCLKNGVTGLAAQMPRKGILLCFPSVSDARRYRRTVIARLDGWTPHHVEQGDVLKYEGFSVWQKSEPLGYLTVSVQTGECL